VLGALRRSEGATSLLPLLDAASDKDDLPAKLFDQANQASQRIRKGLLPAILSHAGGSDLRLRAAALRTLSMQDGPAARLAILGALSSEEPQVFEAALDALAKSPPELAIEQIGQLLGQEQSWHRVRRIAELLEQVALVEGGRSRKAARALLSRISEESDGLARTRALQALKAIDSRSVGDP
jgi:HEAT repeat protein